MGDPPPASLRRTATVPARITTLRAGRWRERSDRLAGEEPLEIRVQAPGAAPEPVVVTMRTPGADFALAAGFLITEGLLEADAIAGVSYCSDVDEDQRYNVVLVRTRAGLLRAAPSRAHPVTAACGVCGVTRLEEMARRCAPITDEVVAPADVLLGLPDALRASQRAFDRTGALHAAGLYSSTGEPGGVYEDVGRHNAVDKVVGAAVLDGRLPLAGQVLMVSGRLSFEIIQKAAVAGVPIVCAVSGPSSLAVAAGEALGVTTVGFLREDRMNIYSHPQRVARES